MKSSDPFSTQIREFYAEKKLPPSSVERIAGAGQVPKKVSPRFVVMGALAAAAVVVLLVTPFRQSVTDRAFDEVVVHHQMDLKPDIPISTGDWGEAEDGLSKLAFPLLPLPPGLEGIELQGARYCSVLSHPAAQLKVARGGFEGTLYVVPADGELENIRQGAREDEGVRVECWRTDDGRLFLLAESAAQK